MIVKVDRNVQWESFQDKHYCFVQSASVAERVFSLSYYQCIHTTPEHPISVFMHYKCLRLYSHQVHMFLSQVAKPQSQ